MNTNEYTAHLLEKINLAGEDIDRFHWLLDNATLTTTLRQGVKVWSLEVVGDYPHDAGMQDVRDMLDILRSA